MPSMAMIMVVLSNHVFGNTPAIAPAGIPMVTATKSDKKVRSIVGSSRSAMTETTGWSMKRDFPRSP